ncbi:hypothetical protein [Nocardia sp. NPDC005366]|uniref:NACHT and WD repeat domain-containing protein n=1 Tax=Nocardia sp. NPDC005366 TaxID=3156878 RepID=UPI0033AC48E7
MSSITTDSDADSPRAVFAERLSELFALAGNPPLKQVAERADAGAKGARPRGAKPLVNFQRIHAWRAGANVPKDFEPVRFVVLALRFYAGKAEHDPIRCQELTDLAEWKTLWEAAIQWRPPVDELNCPYPGLAAYGREDARRFFGRDAVTAELTELIRVSADSVDTGGMVILVGASGAGKSSLLHAGVVPALIDGADDSGDSWAYASLVPGADPTTALTSALGLPDAQWAAGGRAMLVIDQLEELFTVCEDNKQRAIFIDRLAVLATRRHDRSVAVVAAVRADFFAQCLEYPALEQALNKRSYVLGPMRLAELREAVSGPTRAAGLELDRGLTELVVTELCSLSEHHDRRTYDPGALPLLSHVMAATWQHRVKRTLTAEGYRAAGGVAGSIEATAERAWTDLTDDQRRAARLLLLDLVYLAPDGHSSRRRVPRTQLLAHSTERAAAEAALEQLTRARLLTTDRDSVFLTHEIVLSAWPRLRGWVEQDQVGHLLRQQIESDAAEWDRTEHDPTLLYRGKRLTSAVLGSHPLSDIAAQFLAAAQRARARARRVLGASVAAAALLLVVVLVLGLAAYAQNRENTIRRDKELLASILAASEYTRSTDPTLSALFDLSALRLKPDDDNVRTRILATQNMPLAAPIAAHNAAPVNQIQYVRDRKLLISAGDDHLVRLWDVSEFTAPRPLGSGLDHGGPVSSIAVNNAATLLAAASGTSIRLWDITDPSRPVHVGTITADDAVSRVAMSSDGRILAAAADSGALGLWDVSEPEFPETLSIPRSDTAVRSIGLHPDGRWLAVATDDAVRMWSIPDPTSVSGAATPGPVVALPARAPRSLAFGLDGRTLAVGFGDDSLMADRSDPATVALWDFTDPERPVSVGPPFEIGHRSSARAIAFSPDGATLAVADGNRVTVWNIANRSHPIPLGEPLVALSDACSNVELGTTTCDNLTTTLSFGSDDHTLAVGAGHGLVRMWSLPPAVIGGRHDLGLLQTQSLDGRMLVAGLHSDTRLWDISDRSTAREIGDLGPNSKTDFVSPSLSRDGRTVILTNGPPQHIDAYDITSAGRPQHLFGVPNTAYGNILPTGTLLTASFDTQWTFRLWDLANPRHPTPTGAPIPFGAIGGSVSLAIDDRASVLVTSADVDTGNAGERQQAIKLWDISDIRAPRQLGEIRSAPSQPFTWIGITPDGNNLLTLSADALQAWDISQRTIGKVAEPVATHGPNLTSVDISPDGRWIATSSSDSSVQLWDFSDHIRPRPFGRSITLPGTQTWWVSFDLAGRYLTGVGNGTLSLWDIDPRNADQRICTVANQVLTEKIWQADLPGWPYRPPCRESR